jgi:hypothetical protein
MSISRPGKSGTDGSRHNFYHVIHKGLRLGHGRQLSALGSTDFRDDTEMTATLAALRAFIALARGHLEGENREIHSALEARMPGASAHAADDHEDHETSFAEIEALIQAIETAPATARQTAADALYRRYALFAAHDFEHMNAEETALLASLHEAFTDAELIDIERRIVAAIPQQKMAAYLAIMLPAINHGERVALLSEMKAGMPPDVFEAALHGAIRPALDDRSFRAAVAALGLKRAA